MNKSSIKYFCILCLFSLPLLGIGQSASFKIRVDAKTVLLDSYFEVDFILENGDGNQFEPPRFKDFILISGPSRGVSTSIVNGSVSKELRYSFTLQPRRTGMFTIGKASIAVGRKIMETEPYVLEVVEGANSADDGTAQQYFVRAEVSSLQAYVGQQVSLDYKLYTQVDIESYNVLEESEYQSFYAEDVKRYDSGTIREVINGIEYTTKILKRVALFPQQAGSLTIGPMQLQLGIVVENTNQKRNFFLDRQVKRVPARTESISINVMPLPESPPASFTGAVGQFSTVTMLNRNTVTTDDVVSIRIQISGNGDIKRVQAPRIVFPGNFEVYDPKILEEVSYETNGEISGKKVIEYLALPKKAGHYSIEPRFSYFDPDSAKYIFKKEDFEIGVRKGSAKNRERNLAEIEREKDVQDIRSLKTDKKLYSKSNTFLGSMPFWGLTVLPFVFLGMVGVYKVVQDRQNNVDQSTLKSRQAQKVAQKRLKTAAQFLEGQNSRAFYDEISKALLDYVCDKLKIPRSMLSKDSVKAKLQSLKVEASLIEDYIQIIQTAEVALFSGKDNKAAMQETYQKAEQVLSQIESNLG